MSTHHWESCGRCRGTGIRGNDARPAKNTPAAPRGRFDLPNRTTHGVRGRVRFADGPTGRVVAHQPECGGRGAATQARRHTTTPGPRPAGCGGGHGGANQHRRGHVSRGWPPATAGGAGHHQTAGETHQALAHAGVVAHRQPNGVPRQAPNHRNATSVVCAPGHGGVRVVDGGRHRTGPGAVRGYMGGHSPARCPRVADRQRVHVHSRGATGTTTQTSTGGR